MASTSTKTAHEKHQQLIKEQIKFTKPVKKITNERQLEEFKKSGLYADFIKFLSQLSDAAKGKPLSILGTKKKPQILIRISKCLETLQTEAEKIQPIDQPMRYGNQAFRVWFEKLEQLAPSLMKDILKDSIFEGCDGLVQELSSYWVDSFGNQSRIDYGTGHETTFIAFLFCLQRIGLILPEYFEYVVLGLFHEYIEFARFLQTRYMLEPAGTHGVWSLDDYQFLPFYFGAAQLIEHKHLKPKSILDTDVLDDYAGDYMYFSAIAFIHKMKTGPFFEHSPKLYDITAVPRWFKVNSGLLKMYKVEVLGKVPIMQHFLFGSILAFDPKSPSAKQTPTPTSMNSAIEQWGLRHPNAPKSNQRL